MPKLSLKNVNKIYDNKVQAVFDFNLDVEDQEFIVLVGPSGCGKSTTLRMIAGLEEITSGELHINGRLVNDVQPKDRNIAMVFQSYALYPHMTVYDNMAFGLKIKNVEKKEIKRRVTETARILELETYLKRKPKALSGGQRQRVALGRAIVRNAQVFLMDEPLSNLDAKLRIQMRSEIIKLHERIETTTIYVTHDQTEAMTMADRIVIMKDGFIQQVGSPIKVYDKPENMFVANFIGSPAMNFVYGTCKDGKFLVDDHVFDIPDMHKKDLSAYDNKEIALGIRPEDIHYKGAIEHAFPEQAFDFNIEVRELLGNEFILHGHFCGQKILAKVSTRVNVEMHDVIQLTFDAEKLRFFDKETELAITK